MYISNSEDANEERFHSLQPIHEKVHAASVYISTVTLNKVAQTVLVAVKGKDVSYRCSYTFEEGCVSLLQHNYPKCAQAILRTLIEEHTVLCVATTLLAACKMNTLETV